MVAVELPFGWETVLKSADSLHFDESASDICFNLATQHMLTTGE